MLFTCITGTLFPFTGHRSFDWAGPAWLADSPVFSNQVAFTKCVSECLNVPAPVALRIVLNSPLYYMMWDRLCDIPVHTTWPRCLWGCFGKSCYLTQLFLGTMLPQDLLFKAQDMFLAIQWLLPPLQAQNTYDTCHSRSVGVWYNPPARPSHIDISATVCHAKEALSVWLAWLQYMFHVCG